MEFILRILVDLLQPTAQLILLGLTSGWLFWKKNTRWARRISVVTIVLLVIYSTPFLPKLLARTLERQYPVWTSKTDTYMDGIPIMVLGSGAIADTTLHASHQLDNNLHARLMEGIRIYKALEVHKPLLVVSGTSPGDIPVTQGMIQREAAIAMGVDPADIRFHDGPEVVNTASEASVFTDRYGKDHSLILVTSAIHMPRAMYWFRHYGLDPVPAPTEFIVKKDAYRRVWDIWPSAENIITMDRVYHEVVGMIWARISTMFES